MTKKDYILAARTFDEIRPCNKAVLTGDAHLDAMKGAAYFASLGTWTACVEAMADVFAQDNDRFDRDFFIAACKGGPVNKPRAKRSQRSIPTCLDCERPGKLTGHMECQYPGRVSEVR
jgi:hypothetical protein